ncbi:hypothetical protein HY212_05760 [Candidatus Pacearchaeota archaeon]|nr:hypothetical protein [Candidatus Pacearchaeota archaeon]
MKYSLGRVEKAIILAEAVLVLGIFSYLYFSATPHAISPISGKTILEPDFVFEISNGEQVIISKNPNFENSIIMKEGSELNLLPGTYYWKVKNWIKESEVKSFTIDSNVGLNLRRGSNKDILENAGTVPVDVTEKKGGITSSTGIDVGNSIEVGKDNSTYQGVQGG